jgi:NADPH:quinone reductase-like Zn-dependent oxidoreductase
MRVVRLRAPGGPEQLAVEEADRPRPGPAEALVRVHAAAITRGELEWPVDRLPAIPSYELSGVVEEVGPGVAGVAAGDEVYALTPFDRDGVAADYTALSAELLVVRPRALRHAESAAIPLPALAAWQGLFDHGRLGADQRVLIHGAAGGVGGFAVQLARARGAHVIGTASAANLGLVRELGAHEAVDAATRFEDAVEPVDVVFDTAGGERLRRSLAVLRAGGRLVSGATCPTTKRPHSASSDAASAGPRASAAASGGSRASLGRVAQLDEPVAHVRVFRCNSPRCRSRRRLRAR